MNKTCETWIELYGEELGKEIHEILERISADSSFGKKLIKFSTRLDRILLIVLCLF